jgi:hypothetical protein
MGSFFQRKSVRIFLSWFRWCRVSLLLAIFVLVAALSYLHLVGLPKSLKGPLLRHLREKGFQAEFANMHLGWGPSIVIDNGAFRRANEPAGPRLSAGWTQFALNWKALLHGRLELDSFSVVDGRLELPLSATYGDRLLLDNVRLEVALLSSNVAQLQEGGATFRGVNLSLRGEISNFQSLRDWRFPFPAPKLSGGADQQKLRRAAETIQAIHFRGKPQLNLDFVADGREMNSLRAELEFSARGASTPWGTARNLHLRAACARLLQSGLSPFVQIRLSGERLATPWGGSRNLSLEADLSRNAGTNFYATFGFTGQEIDANWQSWSGSNWLSALSAQWSGTATLLATNLSPVSLGGTLRLVRGDSTWGSAGSLRLAGRVQRDLASPLPPNPDWGTWNEIRSYLIDWQADGTAIKVPKLQIDDLSVEGRWHVPQITVQKAQAHLYQGHVDGRGDLDVNSREVNIYATADFDAHHVEPLLAPAAQRFFADFDWQRPPSVVGGLRLVLPPWTNRPENWKEAYLSSVALAADFTIGAVTYRGIPVASAASHFTYTNRVWSVPGLRVKRPEGELRMDYMENEVTHEYSYKFDSDLDPADVFDWIPPDEQPLFQEVRFFQPPRIHAQVRGQWHNREAFAFSSTVAASNFMVHGQTVDSLSASLQYSKRTLRVTGLRLAKNGGTVLAPLVTMDLDSAKITLTNVESTLDPRALVPAIGSNTAPFLHLLSFQPPPSVQAGGSFVLNDPAATDLHFQVEGQNLHWTNLTAEKISGSVQWRGRAVAVTNIQARLYKTGSLQGGVTFDYVPKSGSGFRSDFTVRDIDLPALAQGMSGKASKLEGLLDGRLTLDSPASTNKFALEGRGHISVHDALLWDIKIFGILTPVLNVLSPGAGYSRARSASAIFIVSNGVVSTDDLEITATGFRLLYRGKVGLDKHIDARVEADLLRDTPLLGPFLSFMLTPLSKLFEYHISGTLQNPVIEPLYIPKGLMMLLRPFHTLKSIMPESSTDTSGAPKPPK